MTMTGFIKVATPLVGEEEVDAVREVLFSGQYVSGAKVESFEKKFAEYIGVNHAVAVSSGTAALHVALQAIGVSKGDEVIVPPLTFFATVSSVLYVGGVPVFADIDLDDLCLSPEDVEEKVTPRTKAIIPVHLFGAAAKMTALLRLSEKCGIPLLEDCAQAHGTEYGGKKIGGFGAAGAFSFFATKHITTGEGGIITTNHHDLAESAKVIRNHGMMGRDEHVVLGFNNRMTEMEAAMGLVQLKKLDTFNAARIDKSEYLLEEAKKLPWAIVPVPSRKRVKHTYFWCPLMVKESSGKSIEQLKEHLSQNKVGFRQRYQEPLYRQSVLRNVGMDYSNVSLPNVEKVAGKIIGLPNHPGLTKEDLERIVAVLNSF
jgi:dTDP-4-amino-4,6-dideoxygalactose transaminase